MTWLALVVASAANVGTNVHLPLTDALDLAVDLGGKWVRIDLNWDLAQPAPGDFNWQPFDAVIGRRSRTRPPGLRDARLHAGLGIDRRWPR